MVKNCILNGWQDTLFINRGRHYFENCRITGSTDFIFGGATAWFENCDIICRTDSYITAASTPEEEAYGFVFNNCRIRGENDKVRVYLGRPWRDFSNVIFANCEMSEVVRPEGWHNWNRPFREQTVRYGEYRNTGPGADRSGRVPWSFELTEEEAENLSPRNVLKGADEWNPFRPLFLKAEAHVLWYDEPASVWTEALPVGNGSLGAMVYGVPGQEHLQFNEDTLWGGTITDYSHPGAYQYLGELRRLLFAGKQAEAEELAMKHFMSIPLRQHKYKPFGDIRIDLPGHDQAEDYRRELDLRTGVAKVEYRVGETRYRRETFSSYPDQVLVERIEAFGEDTVDGLVSIGSPHEDYRVEAVNDGELLLTGQADPPEGIRFAARMRVIPEGGSVEIVENAVRIRGASAVTILLAADTSYLNFQDLSGQPAATTQGILEAASAEVYSELRANHVDDFSRLYSRVELDLGSSEFSGWATNDRLENPDKEADPALTALLFHFGRYLLISSSRPGSQPANLQGIWNRDLEPSWGSKYTLNINAEMNYWPAEVANLPECAEPFFSMIDDLVVSGARTAKVHYDAPGWVVHHNTDIWRGTAPINHANHGIWPGGSAWLCQHLWWHYLYSRDVDFLRERAWPVMREASRFYADYLVEDPETGWLISGPSNSPENGGLVMGPTMDHQLIRSLFGWTIEAANIVGDQSGLAEQLSGLRDRIAPNQIGRLGQLQEWLQDIDDPENRHRHVSHLWGVFPGKDITWADPDLMEAARKSLELRGDAGTGWSLGWKINLWARFLDGDHARKVIMDLLYPVHENPDGSTSGPGGVYPNLFDAHPPFQIDGNFGATSGICEMLVQSHTGEIHLLPALPEAWSEGSVKGLRTRGGFDLDLSWKEGHLEKVTLTSADGGMARLRLGEGVLNVTLLPGKSSTLSPRDWNN